MRDWLLWAWAQAAAEVTDGLAAGNRPRVLITPSSFGDCGAEPIRLLERAGLEWRMNPHGRRLTGEEVVQLAQGYDALLAGVEPLSEQVLRQLPDLQVISRVGSGMDNVDTRACKELGITVVNTPYGPTRAVAEHTLALTLALLRHIPQADRQLRAGVWKKQMGRLLQGRVFGIIGLGKIGKEVAQLAVAFGCEVLATDPEADVVWARENAVRLVDLDQLLTKSEVVSLHLNLEAAAEPLLGVEQLAKMREEAFLINTARGSAVDEEALKQRLEAGELAGAALDVFHVEPYDGPFTELENVIVTPHLGSYAREGRLEMELESVRNLLEVLGLESEQTAGRTE